MNKSFARGVAPFIFPFTAYAAAPSVLSGGYYQRGSYLEAAKISGVNHLSYPPVNHKETVLDQHLEMVSGQAVNELVVIDGAVQDKSIFQRWSKPGVAIVEISSQQDGVDALQEILAGYHNLSAVHIISHAEQGVLLLGNRHIDATDLKDQIHLFNRINHAIREAGDLLFYGCELAKGDGAEFLELIANNTHVDVAGSDDATGNEESNGDWDLEIQQGDIESTLPFSELALKDFRGVLGIPGTITFDGTNTGGYNTGNAATNATYTDNGETLVADGQANSTNITTTYTYITAGNNETQVTLYLQSGNSFDATSIYLYNFTGVEQPRSFTVSSDQGDSTNSNSLADLSGEAVTLTGFSGITKLYITPSSGAFFKIDDLAVSNIQAANNAPSDISLDSTSIDDASTGSGAVVGSLSTTDLDGGDTHTYSLVTNGDSDSGNCGASGDDDNASFQIDNANDDLETGGSLSDGDYEVCIETDDGTNSYQENFTITVNATSGATFTSASDPVAAAGATTHDGSTRFLTSIDYDTDGDMDFIAYNGSAYVFYQNNGSGTFSQDNQGLALGLSNGSEMFSADFNNDGHQDIFTPGNFYLNDGDGTFTAAADPVAAAGATTYSGSTRYINDIDYDSDGDTDFIAYNGSAYVFYQNDGSGSFTEVNLGLTLGLSNGAEYLTADFNNDGHEDIFGPGVFYLNDGDGTFTSSADPVAAAGATTYTGANRILQAIDYDSDGDTDFIAYDGSEYLFYENDGSGSFTEVDDGLALGSSNGTEFITVDFDNDGDEDIFAPGLYFRQDGLASGTNNRPPRLSSSSPADDATGISTSANITLTFDETISTVGSATVAIYQSSDDSLVESIPANDARVTGSGSTTITVNPSSTLSDGTDYYLLISKSAFFDADGMTYAGISDETVLNFTTDVSIDSDGDLTASGIVTEPVAIPTTVDTVGEALDVFDFTLTDGGTADGAAMTISEIVVNVTGTASDAIRDQIVWRLDGADESNVTGTYDAGDDTITFTGLNISVANNTSETYTINAYYNDNSGLTEDQTFILSIDGDSDLTVGGGGTQMSSTSAVTNGTGSTVDVSATTLAFTTQPAGSSSGATLTTQPVITAQDAFGNTDVDFTETITLTEASAGSLSGDVDIAAVSGVATFTDVVYTATADQQSFTLTANDQDGVDTDLSTVDSNSLTSDVVATALAFATEPAPTAITTGDSTAFTTVPVLWAVDANGTLDTGYSTNVVLSVTDPDDGTLDGTVDSLTGTGDLDADDSTVTLSPSSGVTTYTGLTLQYTNGGVSDTIALQATSGGLSAVNSTDITSGSPPTVTDGNISLSGASGTGGAFIIGDTATATWDNTGTGDNNSGVTTVTADFSNFGGGAAVSASNSSDTWTASYTIVSGAIDNANQNVSITATNSAGSSTTADTTNATIDNVAPTLTNGNLSISGASGTSGTYVIGDTITATWDDTGTGDSNSDTVSTVTVDFSAFGGGAAASASNSSDTWTATYTIVSGAIDATNLNISATATDNAGNATTTADSTNATVDNEAPTVNDANISISGASGSGGTYVTGDTLTVTWDNTAGGDNNSDTIASATVDFSDFGGGAAVSASNSSDTWTATYTIVSGAIDSTNLNVSVTATDNGGNTTTTADTTNATVDNQAPTVTDDNISISGASGTGGAFITGDTVTATWDDTGSGDNNTDTVSSVTVDFSDFGGGAAITASNSGDTWTATYTITSGSIDSTNLNVSVTATDNGGNTTTTADTTNATADNQAASLNDGNLSISGASGTGGAFITGDTVTATWDNTASGDNNGDVSTVTVDFTEFGGGAAVSASDSSDTWTATYTLTAGTIDNTNLNVSATATDDAGNTTTTADTTNATVDNESLTVSDGNIAISGASGTGGEFIVGDTVSVAWDNSGSGDSNGDTVASVTVDMSAFGGGATVSASNSGDTWTATYTIDGSSTDGSNLNASVSATDNAGNETTQADTSNITIDASAPSISNVTSSTADGHYNSGDAISIQVEFSDSVSVTGTPQLTLETGTTDQTIDYSSGSGSTTLTFTYTVQAGDTSSDLDYTGTTALALNSGTINDASGNAATLTLATPGAAGSLGNNKALVIDTAEPSLAEVTAVTTPTADSTPTYTFSTTETGTLSVGGSCGTSSSTTLSSTGNHTITLTQTDNSSVLVDGSYSDCTVTVTDAAGNASSTLTLTSFTIDTTAPSASSTPDLVAASDSGTSNSDDITNDATPTLEGTAEANATVTFTSDQDGALGSTTADGAGDWSFTPGSDLSDATHSITTVVSDAAGNSSGNSGALSITIDTTAPATPGAADLASGSDTGTSDSDDITNDTTPDLTGSAEANSTIAISSDQDGALDSTTADGAGDWTVTLGSSLSEATHSLTFTATDAAGNTSSASAALSVTVDTSAPTVASLSPTDGSATVQYDDNLVVTFNENVIAASTGSNSINLYQADTTLHETYVADDGNIGVSGTAVTIDPTTNFTPTESYYVQIGGQAFEDTAGNSFAGISDTGTWNFTLENNLPQSSNDSATTDEDAAVAIDVLANDSDEDSTLNPASVTVTSGPADGSTSVNTGTGVVTYTPDADFNGSDSFTYTVEDLQGGTSSSATVSITINAVNDNPVASNDMDSTPEDTAVSIDVAANDSDIDSGDSVDTDSLAVVSGPSDGTASVVAGEILYTPDANFNGSDSFTYTIDDTTGATSNTATVIVNITSVNDLPTATDDSASTDEDNAVDISVLTNDSDLDGTVDATSVSIMTDASNGSTSVDAVTGVVTYTPDADYNGSDSFTYVVEDDSNGTSNIATVAITVNAVNDAPVAVADTAVLLEDTAHTINAKGNDSDVDNDNTDLTLVVVDDPAQGSVVIDSGSFVYTPDADFNGADSFTYQLTDPEGAESGTVTVSLTIQSVNDDPIANNDSVQTDEDTPVDISPLNNDSDGDGTLDASTLNITSQPTQGDLVDNGDGTVTYTPDADYNGNDSFSYEVQDNEAGTSNVATVSLTINAVNDDPVAVDDTAVVDEDSFVDITPLDNDSDVDGTLATLMITGDPGNGVVTVNLDNSVTYTPDTNFDGNDSFTYEVVDNLGATSTSATVSITVNHVNSDPVISGTPDTSVLEDSAYNFIPTLDDQDDDVLSVMATNLPDWLAIDSATGELTGTPLNADVGVYNNIILTVDDGETTVDLAAFSITVVNTNDAPVANDDSYTLDEGDLLTTTALDDALENDVDVDGDAVQAVLVASPLRASSFTFNVDGTFSYQHDGSETARDSFTYQISDGTATSSIATVTLNINAVNEPPQFTTTPTQTMVVQGEIYRYALGVTDPDSQAQISIDTGPDWLTISNGELTGTAPLDSTGNENITLVASDGEFQVNQNFTVEVVAREEAKIQISTSWEGTPAIVDDEISLNITLSHISGPSFNNGQLTVALIGVTSGSLANCTSTSSTRWQCPVNLAVNGSRSWQLTLNPQNVGDVIATLKLFDQDSDQLTAKVTDASIGEAVVSQGNNRFNLNAATALAGVQLLPDVTRELIAGTSLGGTVKLLDYEIETGVATEIGEINNNGETTDVEIADLNNDGLPDVIVVNSSGAASGVYYNEGGLVFNEDISHTEFALGRKVIVQDLNDDDFPEIIIGGNGVAIYVYENQAGVVNARPFVINGPELIRYFAVLRRSSGDAAGSGRMVISSSNAVYLLNYAIDELSQPSGLILLPDHSHLAEALVVSSFQLDIPNVSSLQVVDLDNDGNEEIVAGNTHSEDSGDSTAVNILAVTVGDELESVATLGGASSVNVDIGDFNGDGLNDLMVTNENNAHQIYLGSGSVSNFTPKETVISKASALSLTDDLNGDGLSDILIYDDGDDTVDVFISTGDGDIGATTDLRATSQLESLSDTDYRFRYSVMIENRGDVEVEDVVLRIELPTSLSVESLPADCSQPSDQVIRCNLDVFEADESQRFNFVLRGQSGSENDILMARISSAALELVPEDNSNSGALSDVFDDVEVSVSGGGSSGGSIDYFWLLAIGLLAWQRGVFSRIPVAVKRTSGLWLLLIVSSGCLFKAPNAYAWQWQQENIYIDALLGSANSSWKRNDLQNQLDSISQQAQVSSVKEKRTGFNLIVGYELDHQWAAELGYLDWGTVKLEVSGVTSNVQALRDIISEEYPISGDGFYLGGRWQYPLDKQAKAFVKAGLWRWEGEYDIQLGSETFSVERDGTDLLVGTGVYYSVYRNFSMTLQIQFVSLEESTESILGVGTIYQF